MPCKTCNVSLLSPINTTCMSQVNELSDLLQIRYPFIQAPMLGITSPAMVAAIANEGGLGSLPVGGLSPGKTRELIKATKSLTSRAFAVNLFVHELPQVDIETASAMQDFLLELGEKNGLTVDPLDIEKLSFYSYKDQIDVLIEEGISIVSYTFGIPDDNVITRLKEHDMILIGTATSVREAVIQAGKGIDIIAAQGIEAGGHRGSFLKDEPLPMVSAFSLVPQIIQHISQPVVWAGGIYNNNTIKAALATGARGVQAGTAFIASDESEAIPAYKETLQQARETDIVLTRSFSGRWARGIRNQFMDEVESAGLFIPVYPIQNSLTTLLRKAAQHSNNKEFTNLWAGQSAAMSKMKPAAEIFRSMIAGVW